MARSGDKQRRAERAAQAAALLQEQQRKEKKKQLIGFGIVGVVLAIIAVATYLAISGQDKTGSDGAVPANLTASDGMLIGPADAKHKVVIYEDFLCPGCKAAEDLLNEPLAKAVKDGTASVEYRPVVILGRYGDYSMRTANAFAAVLDTAGAEVAKKFHDQLYADQPTEAGPFHDDTWLIEQAIVAGADEAKIRPAIEDLTYETWATNATDQASKDGLRTTPRVPLNGEDIEPAALLETLTGG